MDTTIVVSSYGAIGTDFNALERTSWIATAYLLTTTSFQPLYGKLSDIFGRKSSLLFAYAVFSIGCLACGLSTSLEQLVAARAFAGIGGGGMTTVVSILISDLVPLRSRGTWQGVLNIVFATGSAAGAPLGGLMADTVGWRWAFLIQFPATIVAITVVSLCLSLPSNAEPHTPAAFKTRLKRVDFLGAGVLVLAVLLLLIGLDRLGNLRLTSPIVYLPLLASLLLFALFIHTESSIAAEPFAPPHIVKEPTILACCLANFFSFGSHMTLIFFLPLYFQAVDSLSAGEAGLRLLPAIAGGVSGSLAGGLIMQKTGRYYHLTVAAYTLPILGALLVFASTHTTPATPILITLGITSSAFGNGIGVTTTLIALIAAAGSADQAVATAVSYLFRALGTVSGVSIGSMLLQTHLRIKLTARLGKGAVADEIIRRVRGSLEYIGTLPEGTQEAVRECYRESLRVAFVFSAILAVGAFVSSLFLKERRLGR